ncbi:MAG: FtsX-like permease family protein, partial [Clostridia bacterium]|nr:FtsX-like permease family protein [Clostridia bacterium]
MTGVVTIYSECWVFIGQQLYEQEFGDASFDSLLVQSNIEEDDQSKTVEKLFSIDGVTGATFTSSEKVIFDNMGETISLIVAVLIVCAGALVVIVLYNLTNINIGERKKEIATLKVLGYNMREVAGYVFREIFLLVILGVLVGFGLGFGLLYFIISS